MKTTLLILLSIMLPGCTSFRTTIMQHSAEDRLYPNQPCAKTKGIPVKIKVPTHVEVVIQEAFFIQATTTDAKPKDGDPPQPPRNVKCREIEAQLDGMSLRSYDVSTQLVYTDKVFTVDFKRPAGGLLQMDTINMDDQQYFQQIAAKYEEQTLEQVTSALGSISSGIKGQSATIDGAKLGSAGLTTNVRTVAIARFDISNPDWEHELNAFVEAHVTSCYGSDCEYKN